jgi:D-alanine-D-alanine ligase
MKKVAVIEGGYSKEKAISVKSAQTVFDNLDRTKFDPVRVLIEVKEWTAYDEEGSYPIDKNDFSHIKNGHKQYFEYAFILIHGTPGEDGKLQGYLDMVGIPYNTSSAAITALTFQKFHCNQFLKNFGINVPEAVLIKPEEPINENQIIEKVKLPFFVKPTDGGSSFGVTKVKKNNELFPAIKEAFKHGNEVIVEQNIEGREVSCGVYMNKKGVKTLPVTEIISENEYFDYDAKYNGKSKEITPADLTGLTTTKIQSLTKEIYGILGMKGIARMDYIISKEDIPFLLEVNAIPGMSKESIIPQMLKVQNLNLEKVLNDITL